MLKINLCKILPYIVEFMSYSGAIMKNCFFPIFKNLSSWQHSFYTKTWFWNLLTAFDSSCNFATFRHLKINRRVYSLRAIYISWGKSKHNMLIPQGVFCKFWGTFKNFQKLILHHLIELQNSSMIRKADFKLWYKLKNVSN